jgi:dinuclear metal center YbgI/SA1388 family protein
MVLAKDMAKYIDSFLQINSYKDYCPNGLQISGKPNIKKLISGVSLNAQLLEQAILEDADAILVHHGLLWNKDSIEITGTKRMRLASILASNINLFAYHLPLDDNDTFGNNVLFGKEFGWEITEKFNLFGLDGFGSLSKLNQSVNITSIIDDISLKLDKKPFHVPAVSSKEIEKVAWCTGAAQDGIEAAADIGADLYISGEISERTFHLAKELDIHYLAVGHHASEVFGVRDFGEHLAKKFDLEYSFINVYNPI